MSPISSDTIMIRFSFRTTRPSDTVPIIGSGFHEAPRRVTSNVDNPHAQLMALPVVAIVGRPNVGEGLTAVDRDIAELLRKSRTPVLVVANKADGRGREVLASEFYELGIGDPWVISALHGTGSGDLLDAVVERLPPPKPEVVDDKLAGRVAILGRPNVGKSSLVNALIGDARSLVTAVPGATGDPVDTTVTFQGKRVLLVDTAGIRRPGLTRGVEQYPLLHGRRARV